MQKLQDKYTWPELTNIVYDRVKTFVPYEKEFKAWFATQQSLGYIVDSILYGKLFLLWRANKKESDSTIVITGREGIGKSTLGMILGSILDPSFNIERVATSPSVFIDNLIKSQPRQAQQIDEGALSLFSRESMTDGNRMMVKTLMVVRKKSQFLIICIPSFKLLDTYIREHRVSLLLHITNRGVYKAVFGEGLKYLSQKLKTLSDINQVKLSADYFWHGKFKNQLGRIKLEDYATKKDDHIMEFLSNIKKEFESKNEIDKQFFYSTTQVARLLSVNIKTVRKLIYTQQIKATKIGLEYRIPRSEVERLTTSVKVADNAEFPVKSEAVPLAFHG